MKTILTAILLGWLVYPAFTQRTPIKFGKVSREEVSMECYVKDSTANAAILCDYGEFDPDRFEFSRTIRYKVFTKEGLNSLILSIPVKHKGMVRGEVFNLAEGKIAKSRLKREDIYEERIFERYTRMRIAPPAAREGSVIDIRYTFEGLPSIWRFQYDIPVVWSELVIPYTEYVKLTTRCIGYEPLSETSSYRWVAKDMPAFQPEPYINSKNNYMTSLMIEISEIHVGAIGFYQSIATCWKDVSEHYHDHPKFGNVLRNPNPYLNDAAEEIQKRSDSETELVKNALAHIRSEVKWNTHERLLPTIPIRKVYVKEKSGTSADMNFLFMKLLRKLDVECYPMILRTREEGLINPLFPSVSRFNYTVSYVRVGDELVAIDAADRFYPLDMLNPNCLNGAGFVVNHDEGEWIELLPEKKEKKIINCNMRLKEDGFMEGNLQVQHAGYAASTFRKAYVEYTTVNEYLAEFEQSHPGLIVMDADLENTNTESGTVVETYEIECDGSRRMPDGTLYFEPVLCDRLYENPFKIEERAYPVDFAYGKEHMFVMALTIPEEYEVVQLPGPVKYVTQDHSGVFQYMAAQNGNTIQVMYQLDIAKPLFMPDEYKELRSFFSLIVSKEAEPVILKRTSTP